MVYTSEWGVGRTPSREQSRWESQEKNHFHNNLKNQGNSKTSKKRLRCRLQHSLGIVWRPQTPPLTAPTSSGTQRAAEGLGPAGQAAMPDRARSQSAAGAGAAALQGLLGRRRRRRRRLGEAGTDRSGRRPCACLPWSSPSPAPPRSRGGAEGPAGGAAVRPDPAGMLCARPPAEAGLGARGPMRKLGLPLPARTHRNTWRGGPLPRHLCAGDATGPRGL